MERGLFRPMRDNPLGGLICSIGVLLILQALAVQFFGVRKKSIPGPYHGSVELFRIQALTISGQRLVVIVFAVVLLGALWPSSNAASSAGPCARSPRTARRPRSRASRSASISMLAMVLGAAWPAPPAR